MRAALVQMGGPRLPDIAPAPRPCGSCPYRCDVPSGIWAEEEYAKLPEFDETETALQPPSAFFCHQQDGRLCAGWVAVHDMQESLGLRLIAALRGLEREEIATIIDYKTDVPLFNSGTAAAAHGRLGIARPGSAARRQIDSLQRKRNR